MDGRSLHHTKALGFLLCAPLLPALPATQLHTFLMLVGVPDLCSHRWRGQLGQALGKRAQHLSVKQGGVCGQPHLMLYSACSSSGSEASRSQAGGSTTAASLAPLRSVAAGGRALPGGDADDAHRRGL